MRTYVDDACLMIVSELWVSFIGKLATCFIEQLVLINCGLKIYLLTLHAYVHADISTV